MCSKRVRRKLEPESIGIKNLCTGELPVSKQQKNSKGEIRTLDLTGMRAFFNIKTVIFATVSTI